MAVKLNPAQTKKAVLMRKVGYTIPAISEKLSISPNALFVMFKRLNVKRGELELSSLEVARGQLLEDAGFIGSLKEKIAAQIVNDLAIGSALQDQLALTLERLNNESDADVGVQSRSLAALATALKTSSEVLRRALNVQDNNIENEDEIPVLTVRKMTTEEEVGIKSGSLAKTEEQN